MKKRSIAARLGVAAMALTLITTSLSSGTLAKYSDTVKGTTKLIVARWNVGASVTANGTKTALATSPVDFGDLANTATKKPANVASGRIAPGMAGGFQINLTSAADASGSAGTEVDAEYVVYIKPDVPGNLPSHFTMKNGSTSINFNDTSAEGYDTTLGWQLGSGTLKAGTSKADLNINWEWPYEDTPGGSGNDADDTTYGTYKISDSANKTTADYTTNFTVTVQFVQAEPTSSTGA